MLQPPLDTNKLWELAPDQFWETSKIIFNWQAAHNPVYKQWVALNKSSAIPFLPISFFKTQDVFIGEKPVNLFESSGTTQDVKSHHWVQDLSLYEASFLKGFKLFYGNPSNYCIIGLLPSYLERKHSSLVYMVDKLIKASGHAQSGFYLDDFVKLNEVLHDLENQKQKFLKTRINRVKRVNILKRYKQSLNLKAHITAENLMKNIMIEQILETLSLFSHSTNVPKNLHLR